MQGVQPNIQATASTVIIKPRKSLAISDITSIWQFRDLLRTLAARDIQIRYKQTFLGAFWALLQPLATTGVATVVFGKILGLASGSLSNYFLAVFPAMIIWTLFSTIITTTSNALVANAEMLRKIYFPRLIIPLSAAGAPLLDFMIAAIVLIAVMAITGVTLPLAALFIPLLILITLIAAVGVGIMLAALTVVYRDFRLIVPFMLQLTFFLTPVLYDLPISDRWQPLISINPMYGIITNFKNIMAGQSLSTTPLLYAIIIACICLTVGLSVFSRVERKFADIV
ncbi:ABC transporter permease [Poriferisphaera sp. WC338]|uniref:ABC transporter permease n=1 Tax=Poriferisphaera sp. WC338 TaxID=3425129 RepID=UPI003D818822